jgi:hypothetical protein
MPKTHDLRPAVGFYALTTLPLRRQEVQTRMRLVAAPTRACTGRRLTFQRRLVTLWAWLMRFPNCGFLPQISHCCAMTAVDPFRGLDGNIYSTGFKAFGTIPRLCAVAAQFESGGSVLTGDPSSRW